LRTLPSSNVATSSLRPIVRTSSFDPLNWNDDVRAVTRRPLIFDSTPSSSSARPSEKYSSSALALRLANGSTAIEATACDVGFGRAPGGAQVQRPSQCAQVVHHVERILEPLAWLLLEAAGYDALEIGRELGAHRAERRWRVPQDRRTDIGERRARERTLTAGQLVEHDPEGEDIGPRIDALAADLLGRHVRHGAQHLPAPESGVVIVATCVRSVTMSGSASLARPKSSTLSRPSRVSITFAGFRSRWTTPFSCAALSASESAMPSSTTRAIGIPPGTMWRSRLWPSTSSMVRKRVPPTSSTEWRTTMFGWLSPATVRASRSKRASRSGCAATSAGSTLTATSRPRRVSRAR
jgi:hypothetical protein